jgi:hypothetical protein
LLRIDSQLEGVSTNFILDNVTKTIKPSLIGLRQLITLPSRATTLEGDNLELANGF